MTDDLRDWAERVYAAGGPDSDRALTILNLVDLERDYDDLVDAVGDDPKECARAFEHTEAIGRVVDDQEWAAFHETEDLPAQVESGVAWLNGRVAQLEAIEAALCELNVIDETTDADDIPSILRLLIAPAN